MGIFLSLSLLICQKSKLQSFVLHIWRKSRLGTLEQEIVCSKTRIWLYCVAHANDIIPEISAHKFTKSCNEPRYCPQGGHD